MGVGLRDELGAAAMVDAEPFTMGVSAARRWPQGVKGLLGRWWWEAAVTETWRGMGPVAAVCAWAGCCGLAQGVRSRNCSSASGRGREVWGCGFVALVGWREIWKPCQK